MDSIRLINYRGLEDTGTVEIKPLTFLLGANSSGKSSFLKILPLLKQSANKDRGDRSASRGGVRVQVELLKVA